MFNCPLQMKGVYAEGKGWKHRDPGISQKFGENKVSFYKDMGMKGHNGLDFPCQIGTKVFASHDGVIKLKESVGFGKYIKLRSESKVCETVYGHLSAFTVEDGAVVNIGDLIGYTGNSGIYTTGPHLHWGLRRLGPSNADLFKWNVLDKKNGYYGAIDPIEYAINWKGTLAKKSL